MGAGTIVNQQRSSSWRVGSNILNKDTHQTVTVTSTVKNRAGDGVQSDGGGTFNRGANGRPQAKRRLRRNLEEVRVPSQTLPALSPPLHTVGLPRSSMQKDLLPGAGAWLQDPLRFSPPKSPRVWFHPSVRITFPLRLKQTSLCPFRRGSLNSV